MSIGATEMADLHNELSFCSHGKITMQLGNAQTLTDDDDNAGYQVIYEEPVKNNTSSSKDQDQYTEQRGNRYAMDKIVDKEIQSLLIKKYKDMTTLHAIDHWGMHRNCIFT